MRFLEARRLAKEPENKMVSGPSQTKGTEPPQGGDGEEDNSEGLFASEAARKLCESHDLEPLRIRGTGKGGLITAGDVRKALAESQSES